MNEETLLPSRVCTALMRLGTRLAGVFDQHFAAMGLTQAQFRTLLAVWEEGGEEGIAPSELAAHLLLDRATITVLSNRLVEQGLLERLPGVNRRTFRLRLTPQAHEALKPVFPRAMALADTTLEHLNREELKEMERLLTRVEDRLREQEVSELRAQADSRAEQYAKMCGLEEN
jgi:DNA-binding MarR family transcriptional regulator